MMWSSIANLKENLNKIALDVHDDDLDIYNSPDSEDSSVSDRRISHSLAHSKSSSHSPIANGFDSAYNLEIEQFKSEIRRLQESEAEIKALSVNYAALLKEKEDYISRLNEENGSLKQNLDATNSALKASRDEISKTLTNFPNAGSGDPLPNRQSKATMKNHPVGNQAYNGIVSKRDRLNGIANSMGSDVVHGNMESNSSNIQDNEKVLADLLEEKNKSLTEIRATHELELKELRLKLEKECNKLADTKLKLQDEQKLNGAFQAELESLKLDKDKTNLEMKKISKELSEKISEVRQLQIELKRKEDNKADDVVKDLKRVIAVLEEENSNLKKLRTLGSFPEREETELSLQKLEQALKEASRERDKALQELNRLKQHLLDKESEESEKMDEDSKIIEELRENNDYLKARNLHLEKALKQAVAGQEEVKIINSNELQKSKEIINDLNKKLASCMSTMDAKNIELLNLQTALGQYYAEIEAKEHLEGDLALVREESAKLSELLKGANQQLEISKREKDELWVKLAEAERMLAEGKNRVNKLEENNAKLRHALEQSMTRLNRMSMDSDFFVDRRIVIKLLVTYFQRNHSKEVLDLMVRMLGFSDEDKQRIGIAQHGGGKGVVRGVLGLPGRLVGGILGGSSAEARAIAASENHSFADMWVDFLLKETEVRDRRESAEALGRSNKENHGMHPDSSGVAEPQPNLKADATTGFSGLNRLMNQNQSPVFSNGKTLQPEHSVSEFSTVPLTSSEGSSRISKLLPKY